MKITQRPRAVAPPVLEIETEIDDADPAIVVCASCLSAATHGVVVDRFLGPRAAKLRGAQLHLTASGVAWTQFTDCERIPTVEAFAELVRVFGYELTYADDTRCPMGSGVAVTQVDGTDLCARCAAFRYRRPK